MLKFVGMGLCAALLLTGCSAPFTGGKGANVEVHGLAGDPPGPAPDFTLTDSSGQPFRLSDQRGKVVLLFFGYTSCPDVCPTTLGDLRKVRKLLGADADRVRVVFVTVDPERDTPVRVGKYAHDAGDPSFVGLTGDRQTLEKVWKAYGVLVQKDPAPESSIGYTVTHSAMVYAIDPEGRLVTAYTFGTPPKDIAADVRRILQGG